MGKNTKSAVVKPTFDVTRFASDFRTLMGSDMNLYIREERGRMILSQEAADFMNNNREEGVSPESGNTYFYVKFPGLGMIFMPRSGDEPIDVEEGDALVCYKANGGQRFDTLAIESQGE